MKSFFTTLGIVVSVLVAVGVFVGFASIVGAVSETETIIGLIFALFVGLLSCKMFGCSKL